MKTRIAKTIDSLTVVAFLLLAAGGIISLVGHWQNYKTVKLSELINDYYANLGTEFISIAITVLVIDRLAIQRQEKRDELRLKAELIARSGSIIRETAVAAISELAQRGWLFDGTLTEANLKGANLKGTILHSTVQGGANLKNAYLQNANLSDMRLYEVNLELAELGRAKLLRSQLVNANLKGANLDFTDLEEAYLILTDLEGAHMFQTNIKNAKLWNANLLGVRDLTDSQLASASRMRDATMPNGNRYDGRYNLTGDIMDATDDGFDIENDETMAAWYGVSLTDYLQGQEWAKLNLSLLNELSL